MFRESGYGKISQANFWENFAVCEISHKFHSIDLSKTQYFVSRKQFQQNFAGKFLPKFCNLQNSAHACFKVVVIKRINRTRLKLISDDSSHQTDDKKHDETNPFVPHQVPDDACNEWMNEWMMYHRHRVIVNEWLIWWTKELHGFHLRA